MSNTEALKQKIKNGILKDHLREMRITVRIIYETIKGIERTGWLNIAIITTMAAILAIFGSLFVTSISLNEFAKQLGNELEISVYLKPDTDAENVAKKISEFNHVEKVTIISKEAAWNTIKKDMDVADVENPLPDTLHVKTDSPENISEIYEKIKADENVEDLNYARDIAKKMSAFNTFINTVTLLVVIFVAILTIAIINNTIQLVIQNRKDEIEIMRLMGVSNRYIKIPLILQGSLYGFAGAFLAVLPVDAVHEMLMKAHEFFSIPVSKSATGGVILSLFVIAAGFGACGSLLSIKKHLRV